MYGNVITSARPSVIASVIGEVVVTPNGNVALRIGRLNLDRSWSQTEYVVLTPTECNNLAAQLAAEVEKGTQLRALCQS